MRKIILLSLSIFLFFPPNLFAMERFDIFTTTEMAQLLQDRETVNRDIFLIRYVSRFGKTNVQTLKYGIRSWLKADCPVEKVVHTGKN